MIALYPGSFDPITLGHVDIIKRTLRFSDKLVIGVLNNIGKKDGFAPELRVRLIREALEDVSKGERIEIRTFNGLLVDFFGECGADVVVRGMRGVVEYEADTLQAHANRIMRQDCETIFMPTNPLLSHISSSRVREITSFGGDVSGMVPECVLRELSAML